MKNVLGGVKKKFKVIISMLCVVASIIKTCNFEGS